MKSGNIIRKSISMFGMDLSFFNKHFVLKFELAG